MAVAVDAKAQLAYVATSSSYFNVLGYHIDQQTGALTPVPGSPFPTGNEPDAVALDPTAQFAYVANWALPNVWGYRVNRQTGAVTPVPGSPFAAGNGAS